VECQVLPKMVDIIPLIEEYNALSERRRVTTKSENLTYLELSQKVEEQPVRTVEQAILQLFVDDLNTPQMLKDKFLPIPVNMLLRIQTIL
jgi:hypothetical protein